LCQFLLADLSMTFGSFPVTSHDDLREPRAARPSCRLPSFRSLGDLPFPICEENILINRHIGIDC
jgi:hypothetical protein